MAQYRRHIPGKWFTLSANHSPARPSSASRPIKPTARTTRIEAGRLVKRSCSADRRLSQPEAMPAVVLEAFHALQHLVVALAHRVIEPLVSGETRGRGGGVPFFEFLG